MVVGFPRLQRPLISLKIDLQSVLQEKMFVGFSAATGGQLIEDHYVLAWSFTTQGTAPPLDMSRLPLLASIYSEPLSRGFIAGVSVAALVLFSLAIAAAVFLIRAINRETIEEWEEYWPHRFTYKELMIAMNRVRDENVLGQWGFRHSLQGRSPK